MHKLLDTLFGQHKLISVRNICNMLRPCIYALCTLVSGATIIEQFLFTDIFTFALICLIPGSDGPIGLHV